MARRIIQKVKISEIVFDKELYPRIDSSWQTAYDYQQSMKTGAKFPPITLAIFNKKLYLVDGKHRVEAYKLNKVTIVEAEVFLGWNKRKIFEEAVRRNIAHGRILSPFEKRRIALKLRVMNYPDSAISELVQIPMVKLENFIGQRLINAITGEEIVKSEIKHLSGQDFPGDINITQKQMYNTSQAALLKDLIRLIEKNLLDLQNQEIVKLVLKLKQLLKKIK